VLTRVLGQLPVAPAALIYTRPGKLVQTLPDFNDRTVVQQAVESAAPATAATPGSDWAGKANAICAAGGAQVASLKQSDPGNYKAQSSVTHTMLAQLSALTPPAGQKAAVRSANALLEQSMTMLDQVAAKASSKAAVPLFVHALTYMAKGLTVYDRLGATTCTSSSSS